MMQPSVESSKQPNHSLQWQLDDSDVAQITELVQLNQELVQKIAKYRETETALSRYAERLKMLREIDQAILAAESPEAIARAAMAHITKLIPCQRASITLFDFEKDEAIVLAARILGGGSFEAGTRFPLSSFGGDVALLQAGQIDVVEDVATANRPTQIVQILQREGLRAYLCAPLVANNNLIGSLNIGWETPSLPVDDQIELPVRWQPRWLWPSGRPSFTSKRGKMPKRSWCC